VALEGAVSAAITRSSYVNCASSGCHGSGYTAADGRRYEGVPLWLAVGLVDDKLKHGKGAFDAALARKGYRIYVFGANGRSVVLDSRAISNKDSIILSSKVNGTELPAAEFPMRLVGPNSQGLANFGTGAAVLFSLVGCFTYANFYLAAPPFHLNAAQLGSIFFVYLVGVVITPMSGKFLDRYGFRRTAFLYCAMMIAGLLLTLAPSLAVVIAGLTLFSSGVFIAQAAATVETGAIAGRARSSAAGLYVTFYYLGGSMGAVVTGWCWQWARWRGCVALLAAAAAVSLKLALLSSRPGEKLHPEEAEIVGD
jgi:hypothetical protein